MSLGPANVLVDQTSGAFTLIDWDEIGPISPSRELASQLWTWHLHNGQPDIAGIRETVTAYREAGGTADISDLGAFSFGLACDLNYLADEISAAMDTEMPPSMREYAERQAERFLADLPSPGQLAAIVQAARTV
ncbi:hypothetical protein [Actinopolymorpha rutila]|uniref:Aminoglycoside phosphotransferase (APT) family kinase protein n=1 Tax=Actinopolymorpha rutila TaxID=446787 RepID=A0A852ZNJ2_9ACTN|nr:hypothetical protein [Actinopolymorpha rutila]NYH93468.1 aminoglycoside phosphotransferase (APT) family kinase protein [Actinopolymorpha rutila]